MAFISVRFEPVEDGIHSTLLNGDVYVYTLDEENHTNSFIEPRAFNPESMKLEDYRNMKKSWILQLRSLFGCDNVVISSALHMALWQKARYVPKTQEEKEDILLLPTQEEIMDKKRESWAFAY